MRILVVHNHYGDHELGGEAVVVKAEVDLLRAHGHAVDVYERTNAEIQTRGCYGKLKAFWNIPWSPEGYAAISEVIDKFRPDIMHVHNYKYLLSPSIFGAAKQKRVATVLTLHNYRLACPAGQFLRHNRICEDCLRGFPYRMLWHRCASNNPAMNLAQFRLYRGTRRRGLLASWIDAYIVLSEFGKRKFMEAGVPAERIHVKSNFLEDPVQDRAPPECATGAIFVGRLSREKGCATLIKAWSATEYPLTIVGDGPMLSKLRTLAPASVHFTGQKAHALCLEMMLRSAFVVFPSEWYEGCPLSLLEAMAAGRAVVASDLGPRREVVHDGETGLLFEAGNPNDLKRKAAWLIEHPHERERMARRAREMYLQKYTPEKNYDQLIGIYERALENKKRILHACSG